MDHVDHLLLMVGHLGCTIVFHHDEGGATHGVNFSGFAAAVGLAVKGGETADHFSRKFGFSEHEDALPGNEDLVEDKGWAVLAVANIAAVGLLRFHGYPWSFFPRHG